LDNEFFNENDKEELKKRIIPREENIGFDNNNIDKYNKDIKINNVEFELTENNSQKYELSDLHKIYLET
jgi:hypothetical protein